MRAVVYNGPEDVSVQDVPDPTIENPLEAIIKITTTNICGSDLHPYEGRAPLEPGTIIGHENMGTVAEVGPGVERIKVGDRVSVPFNVACGTCRNCNRGFTNACQRANPLMPGGAYGFPKMGPWQGGQAEFMKVPWADFNLLKLPPGTGKEKDYAMVSDVFPTGYHAAVSACVEPGKRVAIFGAGPVGLMAALSSDMRGAIEIFVVDHQADRLALAAKLGATPIKFGDHVSAIEDATKGYGVDCAIEAVGYQAHDSNGDEDPAMVFDDMIAVTRATGHLGVVGVYVSEDPGAVREPAKDGRIGDDYGSAWEKGLSIAGGQCPVKAYNRELRDAITHGKAKPGMIVSHEVGLDEAVDAYEQFDVRSDGWTKVLIHP